MRKLTNWENSEGFAANIAAFAGAPRAHGSQNHHPTPF
jgi:hypothetical protein